MQIVNIPHGKESVNFIVRDERQWQQRSWLRRKFYEQAMLEYILRLNLKGVYVDVGANIGNHTTFFAKFTQAQAVVAIEPVTSNIELLRANVAFNQLSHRVDAYPVAVSNYKGRGAMERFGPPAYDGMQKLVEGDEVNVMLLDEVLSLYGKAPIVLIKIDVEYHEKQVIEGAQKTIERYKPWLFVETTEPKEILSMLPSGYTRGKRFNASPTWEFVPPKG